MEEGTGDGTMTPHDPADVVFLVLAASELTGRGHIVERPAGEGERLIFGKGILLAVALCAQRVLATVRPEVAAAAGEVEVEDLPLWHDAGFDTEDAIEVFLRSMTPGDLANLLRSDDVAAHLNGLRVARAIAEEEEEQDADSNYVPDTEEDDDDDDNDDEHVCGETAPAVTAPEPAAAPAEEVCPIHGPTCDTFCERCERCDDVLDCGTEDNPSDAGAADCQGDCGKRVCCECVNDDADDHICYGESDLTVFMMKSMGRATMVR